jgi:hypothetical protein
LCKVWGRDVNKAENVRRKLPSAPPSKLFLVPDPCHGEIFVLIPISTDFHGFYGDPLISNISKKIILFGQNYDTSLTLFYPFYQKKKQIFCIFLFLKIKTTHNAFITKHVPMQKYLATNNHTKTHSQNILNHSRKEK